MRIAQPLRGMQVLHVSSTFYGGGGLKQQIEYGVSGFPVGSMDEAAQRMAQLLENEALRKQIGAEGQKTCASVFSCRQGRTVSGSFRRLRANASPSIISGSRDAIIQFFAPG